MKCIMNWIPLRIRVRSRNTQPHLEVDTIKTRGRNFFKTSLFKSVRIAKRDIVFLFNLYWSWTRCFHYINLFHTPVTACVLMWKVYLCRIEAIFCAWICTCGMIFTTFSKNVEISHVTTELTDGPVPADDVGTARVITEVLIEDVQAPGLMKLERTLDSQKFLRFTLRSPDFFIIWLRFKWWESA